MRFTFNRRLAAAVAAGVLAVASLAACGSNDTSSAVGGSDGAAGGTKSAGSSSSGFAKDSNTLVFGLVPDSSDAQTNYQPLMDWIAKQTGLKVEFQQSTDYSALIQAAIAGKLDVASFSGLTYVQAKNHGAKITPISAIITAKGQPAGYYSEAIVPANSSITKLQQYKGKKICFVDPSSTSGYLFPALALNKVGISAAQDSKDITPVFAGAHDVSVQKVEAGKDCDAGFAEDAEAEPAAKAGKLKIIEKQMVPGAPLVVSDSLPDATKQKVITALKQIDISQIQQAGISGANSKGFESIFYGTVPVNDNYYASIRDICKNLTFANCA